MEEEEEKGLVWLCLKAASENAESVERWRRQRRTLERLPSQLADALFLHLLRRRLLYPSLLEVFQPCVEEVDLKGESCVDAEWMAYLGAFRHMRCLNLSDCRGINNYSLWPISRITSLKELDLSRCSKITDDGVEHLLSIPNLEKLHISETRLTSNGVLRLASLINLRVLDLGGLPVTDRALCSLQALMQLEYLDLWGSKISNDGAALLTMFPKLSYLNLAWTNVNKLPSLPSVTCLNMSNCTICSIFEGDDTVRAPLSKLFVTGSTFIDVDEAFSYMQVCYLLVLDLSKSSIGNFHFLANMELLEYLDLSSSRMTDDLIEPIVIVGSNLIYLNLNNTKVTSHGVCFLAGNFPKLETLSLSHTLIDDASLPYISVMPSLRVINLSNTNIKGFTYSGENGPDKILSLNALQNLDHLEILNLEETQVRDEALHPLANLRELNHLYLKRDFLSDISLHALSSLPNLKFLGIRGAVLTNSGLSLFRPPKLMHILDLRGCWLLTKDVISSFCKSYPQIEVRHEFGQMPSAGQDVQAGSSVSQETTKASSSRSKVKKTPKPRGRLSKDNFADERIKYSREEMLELQFSPLSNLRLVNPDIVTSGMLRSK